MSIVTVHNVDCEFGRNENISEHSDEGDVPLYLKKINTCENLLRKNERVVIGFVRDVACYVLRHENVAEKNIAIALLSKERMRQYNAQFCGKDFPTDVLSFSAGDMCSPDTCCRKDEHRSGALARNNSQYRGDSSDFYNAFDTCVQNDAAFSEEFTGYLGDILVCLEYVERQSHVYAQMFERELARVIIHGVLHLLGYIHKSYDMENDAMLRRQERILKSFVFSNLEQSYKLKGV